jgi:LacI family transcriptional regulator
MELGKRRINSAEIAKLTGLSRSTVSRVINNYPNVKEETRNKVKKVIEQFGYTPNISARVLAGKNVNTLGLFFLASEKKGIYNFSQDTHVDFMLACIAEAASKHGFSTLITVLKDIDDPDAGRKVEGTFKEGRIDAGIFIGFPNYTPIIEELIADGFIVGILDQYIPDKNELNRVVVNFDDDCAEKAVDYLVSLGHKKIMGMHGDLRRYSATQRYESFIKAIKKHNLELRDEWVLFSGFSTANAYNIMLKFISNSSELPSAIFCVNDTVALGVVRALKDARIEVPKDISVIGIDDSYFSALMTPPLTTFHADFDYILGVLTAKVIEGVNGILKEPVRLRFGSELIVRASCRALA